MFSIIIPVYNKYPHLKRSINSVLKQNYPEWELILVDDGSTDGSRELLQEFPKLDERVRVFYRDCPGPGGYLARNLGIRKAKYDWIAFLDADDEWMLNKLECIRTVMLRHSDISIFSSGWVEHRPSRVENDYYFLKYRHLGIHSFDLKLFLTKGQPLCTSTSVINRKLLLDIGGFDSSWKMGADLDTWLRLLMTGAKGVWIDKILAIYYLDSVNMVTNDTTFLNSPVVPTIRRYLQNTKPISMILETTLKKYSNRVILYSIKRRIRKKNGYRKMVFSDFYFSPLLIDKIYLSVLVYLLIPFSFASYLLNRRLI